MRKVIFPALLVAMSLVFFSFKPMNKQVGIYDKATGNIKFESSVAAPSFTRYYDHGNSWSKWKEIWTSSVASLPTQTDILNKY